MIIPGFSDYDITPGGLITCLSKRRDVKHTVSTINGMYKYKTVVLVDDNGMHRTCNVIRLLAMTYLEKPEARCVARAKDNDNTNAVLSNVEWVPYADVTKRQWESGKMDGRKKRQSSVTEDFIDLLYDTLCLYDEPVTVTDLSHVLDVPYTTARYAMVALRNRGKATKVKKGFEAIR